MRVGEALGALSERPFRNQFFATASSVVGDNLVPVALAFAVLELTGSATDLGAVMAVRVAVMVVFFLAGGVWADRMPRQRLMMISDVGRFATQGALGLLLVSGVAELWHFVVLEAVNGAATAFFRPAQVGLTPKTVSPERLQQANALLSLTYSAAAIAGPALGGVLVAVAGAGWALIADALTFAVSAYFLLRIDLPPSAQKLAKQTFLEDLRSGWGEVRSRTWVWVSILNFMVFQFLALPAMFILGPFIVDQSYGGASTWAAILTVGGIGSLLGDLVALRVEPKRPLRASHLSGLLTVPPMILLGVGAPAWIVVASMVPWGVCMSFGGTLWFTVLQEHIPDEALSRVSSYDWIGSTALRPLGFAFAGPVSEAFGQAATLIGVAVLVALAQIVTASIPSVARLPRHAGIPAAPQPNLEPAHKS